jgi:hypothetical protein
MAAVCAASLHKNCSATVSFALERAFSIESAVVKPDSAFSAAATSRAASDVISFATGQAIQGHSSKLAKEGALPNEQLAAFTTEFGRRRMKGKINTMKNK